MYDLIYNGKNLTSLGYVINDIPDTEVAERDFELVSILGGDGSELNDNGGYKNVERKYEISSFPYWNENKSEQQLAQKLKEWLYSEYGSYKILRDSFNPGYFCYAIPKTPNPLSHLAKRVIDTSITFERKPFWYSDKGNKEKVYSFNTPVSTATIELINPESEFSKPYIKIEFTSNTGIVTLSKSGAKWSPFKITSDSDFSSIEIDSASERVYSGSKDFDDKTTCDYFPTFVPGDNKITIAAETFKISKITIIPRWRRL